MRAMGLSIVDDTPEENEAAHAKPGAKPVIPLDVQDRALKPGPRRRIVIATNIAETVYYLVHGRPITDQRPKGDTTSSTAYTSLRSSSF